MSEENTTVSEGAGTLEERVKAALDEIRPYIQGDGGDIDFVAIEGAVLKVQLKGACAHCPGATMTLKMGVERRVKQSCPEIESVEAV